MQAIAKSAEINEHHRQLKILVGSWSVISRVYIGPGERFVETKGTAEKRLILGGRFLQEDFTGTMLGTSLVGHGITGYDNALKKYITTWADSMSTAVLVSEGTMDAARKEMIFVGRGYDPMSQTYKTYRQVVRIDSDKQHSFEWFEPGSDGKEAKLFEVIYLRQG